jgi:hypothetical protein
MCRSRIVTVEFYATVDAQSCRSYMPADVSYLLPASSYARFNFRKPNLPPHVTRVAADCGGFVATKTWGDYRFRVAQYVRWLETWDRPPVWAAMMDYCCEEEIAGANDGVIRDRQDWTTEYARYFIQQYGDAPWAWVPTVQGWDTASYARHARQLFPLVSQLKSFYADRPNMLWDAYDGDDEPAGLAAAEANMLDFRVGIGTLCRRASVDEIRAIVAAVADELPSVKFHLWGVKLGALQRGLPEQVASVDSAAWNGRFGTDIELQRNSGLTQREYGFKVALPRYLGKVDAALGQERGACVS